MKRPEPGDYWRQQYFDITIYGQAMTLEEIAALERQCGADAEELDHTMRQMRRRFSEGYIWGMAYSVACPEGEYGSTPVCVAEAISKEDFLKAQQKEWTD